MMFNRKKPDTNEDSGAAVNSSASTPSSQSDATQRINQPVHNPCKRLGDMLVEEGVISQKQLEEALAVRRQRGGFLGHILIESKIISEDTLISLLVKQCKIPHLSLLDYDISDAVLHLLPQDICLNFHVLPIDKLGKILTVAMVDPLDADALERMRSACPDLRIKPILCSWKHYEVVAKRLREKENSKEADNAEPPAATFGLPLPPLKPAAEKRPAEQKAEAAIQAAVDDLLRENPPATSHPTPAAPNSPPSQKQTDAHVAAHVGSAELAAAIRDALRDAFGTLSEDMRNLVTVQNHREETINPETLMTTLRDSVREAVQELSANLSATASPAASSSQPTEAIVQVLQESLASGLSNALAPLREDLAALYGAVPQVAASPPSAQDLAATIRDSIHDSLQEMTAALSLQLSEMARHIETEAESASVTATQLDDLKRKTKPNYSSVRSFSPAGLSEAAPPEKSCDDVVLEALDTDVLSPDFTFENFLVGKTNAFTVSLAQAVTQTPGTNYNPFFLYGDVGLGKTHLINAIGNGVLSGNSELRVGYVSSSRFATRYADAVRDHAGNAFRENYGHWDVLILDDVQFLGGRVEAQEEFFHIFNGLHQANRQIIIASDKAPDKLGLLEQRLVSRFAGGIVAPLKPPEYETRLAILHQAMSSSKLQLSDEVLAMIAMRVPNDVRKMTGALRKIVAFAELVNKEISYETADEILSHLGIEQAA